MRLTSRSCPMDRPAPGPQVRACCCRHLGSDSNNPARAGSGTPSRMPAAPPALTRLRWGVRFLNDLRPQLDLTYDDVFMVPNRSSVTSRLDVDLATVDGTGTTIPLVVANMTAIAGRRMAETTARRGALTVIPQDIPAEIVRDVVAWQKSRHLVYDTPITLDPTMTVGEALVLLHKRAHGAAIVTVGDRPVGIVTETDLTGVDRFTQLEDVMVRDMVTLQDGVDVESAFDTLSHARRRLAPVVADDGRLVGILTRVRARCGPTSTPPPSTTTGGCASRRRSASTATSRPRPRTCSTPAPTCSSSTPRTATRRRCSRPCGRCGRSTPGCRSSRATSSRREGTRDLIEAGADIVKVGVGPGAMCTTRMMTAVGRPQFSAVLECAAAARELGRHVWADGGVRHPRDVALALAAGASNVMIGSWFAGTLESPGDLYTDEAGPPVQGVRSAWRRRGRSAAAPRATRPTSGPARRCSRRASARPACTSTRPARASRTSSTRSSPGLRSSCTLRRRTHPRGVPRAGDGRHPEHRRLRGGTPAAHLLVTPPAPTFPPGAGTFRLAPEPWRCSVKVPGWGEKVHVST